MKRRGPGERVVLVSERIKGGGKGKGRGRRMRGKRDDGEPR